MNKELKFTISAGGSQEFTFPTGVCQIAVTNANGEDGGGGVVYTAGDNIQISEENVISATDTTYTAGEGIAISEQNVISNTAEGNTDIIAEEYDRYKSYNIGDYCIYNNKLYKCLTQIESTEWYTQLNFQEGSVRTTYEFINGSGKFGFYKSGNYYYVIACTTDNAVVERTYYQSGFEPNVSQFALTDTYIGIVESGFYNRNSIGSYTSPHDDYFNSQNDALYDFFSRPYFDTSNWAEVTVTDEIKDMPKKYDIYTTAETVVGTWHDGKPIYRKILLNAPIGSSTVNIIDSSTSYKYLIDGIMCLDGMTGNAIISNACAGMTLGLQSNSLTLVKRVQADYSGWNLNYVIVYYTKTNDYD